MKDCDTCGNEIPDNAVRCPFCDSQQQAGPRGALRQPLRTVNIKADMPSAEEALVRLDGELLRAKQSGVRVVRLIHGYGSAGVGGKLRDACRAFLNRKLGKRQIKQFTPGEEYSRATNAGRDLLGRYPDLRSSEVSDRQNPGITFVEL